MNVLERRIRALTGQNSNKESVDSLSLNLGHSFNFCRWGRQVTKVLFYKMYENILPIEVFLPLKFMNAPTCISYLLLTYRTPIVQLNILDTSRGEAYAADLKEPIQTAAQRNWNNASKIRGGGENCRLIDGLETCTLQLLLHAIRPHPATTIAYQPWNVIGRPLQGSYVMLMCTHFELVLVNYTHIDIT